MKNALQIAEDGLGDGTIYKSGSSVTAINQASKVFDLTGGSTIPDLGADVDDQMNGYILYFPASGNKYHIVDWVASNNNATTFETPDLNDTGAWEIRANLQENDMSASNPAFMFVDGLPSVKGKNRLSNDSIALKIYLPNMIGQAGFEERPAGAFPTGEQAKGLWYQDSNLDWTVEDTSVILGSRHGSWTPGGVNAQLYQRCVRKFEKGKKYQFVVKARANGGSSDVGAIRMALLLTRNTNVHLDPDWEVGVGGDAWWDLPVITTTAQWFFPPGYYVPDFDSEETLLIIGGMDANKGSATSISIDEIYVWEVVNVESFLSFNHNFSGVTTFNLDGAYCNPERSNTTPGTDVITILGNTAINTSGPFHADLGLALFPVYRINLPAVSGIQYEAGQILLCEKWEFEQYCFLPHTLEEREVEESSNITKGGVRQTVQYYEPVTIENRVIQISATEKAKWDEWRRHHHSPPNGKQPFVFRYSDTEGLYLMESDMNRFAPTRTLMGWDVDFRFREVL